MYVRRQLRREPEGVRQKAYLLAALADFCVVANEEEEGAEAEEGVEEGTRWERWLVYICVCAYICHQYKTTNTGLAPQDLFVHAPTHAGSGAGEGGWIAALKGKWRQHHHGHGHGHHHSQVRPSTYRLSRLWGDPTQLNQSNIYTTHNQYNVTVGR